MLKTISLYLSSQSRAGQSGGGGLLSEVYGSKDFGRAARMI